MRIVAALILSISVVLAVVSTIWQEVAAQNAQQAATVYLPLIYRNTAPPTPCNQKVQALVNPSFEQGLFGWSWINQRPGITSTYAHSGSYSLLLGDRVGNVTFQDTTVPAWADNAALYYSWLLFTQGADFPLLPSLYVSVDNHTQTLAEDIHYYTEQQGVWHNEIIPINSISNFRGQTIEVGLGGSSGTTKLTWWYLDDISLVFGCGNVIAGQ